MNSPHPEERAEFIFGLALTLGLHTLVVVCGLMYGSAEPEPSEQELLMPVLSTELLQWGEVMPEEGELPFLPNPEEAPTEAPMAEPTEEPIEVQRPDEEVVNLAEPEEREPVEERQETRRAEPQEERTERSEAVNRGQTNTNRPTNNLPRYGAQDGHVGGTSLSRNAMRNEYAEIQRQIQRELSRPSNIPDSVFRSLSAVAQIEVNAAGNITDFELIESSGNASYDRAVRAALARFRSSRRLRLSTLDINTRRRWVNNGAQLTVTP